MRINDPEIAQEFGFMRCPECGHGHSRRVLYCEGSIESIIQKEGKPDETRSRRCGNPAVVPFPRYQHLLRTVRQKPEEALHKSIIETVVSTFKDDGPYDHPIRLAILETPGRAVDYARSFNLAASRWSSSRTLSAHSDGWEVWVQQRQQRGRKSKNG